MKKLMTKPFSSKKFRRNFLTEKEKTLEGVSESIIKFGEHAKYQEPLKCHDTCHKFLLDLSGNVTRMVNEKIFKIIPKKVVKNSHRVVQLSSTSVTFDQILEYTKQYGPVQIRGLKLTDTFSTYSYGHSIVALPGVYVVDGIRHILAFDPDDSLTSTKMEELRRYAGELGKNLTELKVEDLEKFGDVSALFRMISEDTLRKWEPETHQVQGIYSEGRTITKPTAYYVLEENYLDKE